MKISLQVDIELEKVEGKSASKEDIIALAIEELDDSNPESLFTEDDTEYSITSWNVTEIVSSKKS